MYKRLLSVYSVWADVEAITSAKVDDLLRKISLDVDMENAPPMTPANTAEMQQPPPDNTNLPNSVELQQHPPDEDMEDETPITPAKAAEMQQPPPDNTNLPNSVELQQHPPDEDLEDETPITPPNAAEIQPPDNINPLNSEMPPSSADESSYEVLKPLPLSTLCPQCFGDNPRAKFGHISIDGNFQHKRFPTKKGADNKYLELRDRRLFIDDGTIPDVVNFHI